MQNDKIIVLALGNEVLRDASLPFKLNKDLQKLLPTGIHFDTCVTGGIDILDFIENREIAFFIDTLISKKNKPGHVSFYTPENFMETSFLSSVHDASFLTTLELGKRLSLKMPVKIFNIAIEVVEDKTLTEELTPEIQSMYNEILQKIHAHIETCLKQ